MFSLLARLILLLLVISLIRSVVRVVQRAWVGMNARGMNARGMNARQHVTGPDGGGLPITTMLQQDPVCGTYVAIDSSLKRIMNGRVVHFCSAECRDKYRS